MIDSTVVVFVHGMYMNGLSWQPWEQVAGERGYTAHAPSWPYHDGEPAVLRRRIEPALGRLTFGQVVDHYKSVLATLPERPVLIGHSVGGLAVQKLVNEGYGTAGVVLSPAPPRGIFPWTRTSSGPTSRTSTRLPGTGRSP